MKKFIDINALPYGFSNTNPIFLTGRLASSLALGVHSWATDLQTFSPEVPLNQGSYYFFTDFSVAADLPEADFEDAIATLPSVTFHQKNQGNAPIFRQAMTLPKYIQRKVLAGFLVRSQAVSYAAGQGVNALQYRVQGTLNQTANIIALGKTSITLTLELQGYEIGDPDAIALLMQGQDRAMQNKPRTGAPGERPRPSQSFDEGFEIEMA